MDKKYKLTYRQARLLIPELGKDDESPHWFHWEASAEDLLENVSDYLSQNYARDTARYQAFSSAKETISKWLLPQSEFTFLCRNKRVLYWLWGYLMRVVLLDEQANSNGEVQTLASYNDTSFGGIPLHSQPQKVDSKWLRPSQPMSPKDRLDQIIGIFDMLRISSDDQKKVLQHLYEKGCEVIKRPLPLSWLKPNDYEQARWVWAKLERKWPFEHTVNDKELYHIIIASMDLLGSTIDAERILLCKDLSVKWSNAKYRKKVKSRKVLNTHLDPKAKRALDKMVKNSQFNQGEFLDYLILKEAQGSKKNRPNTTGEFSQEKLQEATAPYDVEIPVNDEADLRLADPIGKDEEDFALEKPRIELSDDSQPEASEAETKQAEHANKVWDDELYEIAKKVMGVPSS